ncbi:MAG: hypothetical protein MUC29_04850 [Pyrinomonadaceae bacterium]|jgi:hypothetical protein|nr:hypothetical protein [Pyrinomonadaceae bacterium]
MTTVQTISYNLVTLTEAICALVALFHLKELKNTHWKWFVAYIVTITVLDIFGDYGLDRIPNFRKYYYSYLVIPLQFIFFYWLIGKKSLKSKPLFLISSGIYFVFFFLHFLILDKIRHVSSMSYSVGVFLLGLMVYLEFIKQIKSDEILDFKSNKMFYINVAVMLFYVGTLPFFAFDKILFEKAYNVWNNYFSFFLLSVNIMYLLFIASFIWGKPKS